MFCTFLILLVIPILTTKDVVDAAPPKCRANICDDRPECPKSSCPCLFSSRMDCATYYQCVDGKPFQYKCSPGLFFNGETLTCDYSYNVNCSFETTIAPTQSTEMPNTTSSELHTTTKTVTETTTNGEPDYTTTSVPSSTVADTETTDITTTIKETTTTTEAVTTPNAITTSPSTETETAPSSSSSPTEVTTPGSTSTEIPTSYETDFTTVTLETTTESEITTSFNMETTTEVANNPTDKTTKLLTTNEVTTKTDNADLSSTTTEIPEDTTTTSEMPTTLTPDIQTTTATTYVQTEETTTENVPSTTKIVTTTVSNPVSTTVLTTTSEKSTTIPESPTTIPEISTTVTESPTTIPETSTTVTESPTTIPESPTTISESSTTVTESPTTIPETSTVTESPTTIPEISTTITEKPTTPRQTTESTTMNATATPTAHYTTRNETTPYPDVTTITPPAKFVCPTRFGLFPDPKSCFRFYQCSHWIPYHKWCPSELHFNPNLQVCDWPYRAGCEAFNQKTTTTEVPSTTPSHQNDTHSSCDCDFCQLPVPGNCTLYSECIDRVSTRKQCADGLYFNPMTGTCDLQENVQCTTDIQCPETGRFLYPGSCSYFVECQNGKMAVKTCPEGLQFNKSSEMCSWTGSCSGEIPDQYPSGNISVDVAICEGCSYCFKPYSSDCSRYVRCYKGTATEEKCAPGLFFNPSTQLCDHDYNVDCPGPEPQLECPKMFGFFPYPGECRLYLHCVNGTATVKSCPGVLHFDVAEKRCDWPWSAGCGNSDSTPTPEYDMNIIDCDCDCCLKPSSDDCRSYILCIDKVGFEGSCSSGLLFNPQTENCDFAENVQCNVTSPDVPAYVCPEHQGLFPHPEDCRKFIHCDHGIPHVKNCPSDLHFNPQLKVCDWPYSAGCQSLPIIPPTEDGEVPSNLCDICNSCFIPVDGDCTSYIYCRNGTSEKLRCKGSLLFNPETEACDLAGNVDCPNPQNLRCPKPDGLFPAQDCTQFIHCSNGIAYLKDCPAKLHFNPQTLVCDWPESANCGKVPIEPTDDGPMTTKGPDDGDQGSNQTCDCECCFLPNTKDCSKYFLCLDGYLHEGQCSRGLLFNPSIQNCDLAERVICGEDSPLCPEPNGLFPNRDECSSFVRCSSGTPQVEHCPNGTHFSPGRDQCLNPCEAKCDTTVDCQRTSSTTVVTYTTNVTTPSTAVVTSSTETSVCIDPDGSYPVPNDCSSYYVCSSGKPYSVSCPDGLHYSIEYEVCEDPCDAQCDHNLDCSPSTTPKTPSSTSSPHCVEPEGIYPVVEDCTAFYLCSNGKEHVIHCPPGLHYSIQMGRCEDPCFAHCNASVDCSTSTKPSFSSSTPQALSPECPEANGLFSNPNDCESFYQCTNGRSHLIRCPSGLHFSLDDAACEYPCVAGCDINIVCPTEIPDNEGNCTCEACYLPDPSDCSAFYFCSSGRLSKNYCPIGMLFDKKSSSCKEEDTVDCEANGDPSMCPEPFGYFPYPGDCKKFLHCDGGVAHVKDCAGNLEYDPQSRVCTKPKGYCGETPSDPNCPEPTGLFPDPNNCSLFYHCEHGVAYPKHCTLPLMFNPVQEVCDWPENVDCGKDFTSSQLVVSSTTPETGYNTPNSTLSSTSSSSNYPISSTSEPCYEVPGVICPCACRVPTYDECSSFFQCREDGTACKKYCPEGLYFNKREMVCDLPTNVECRDFFFTTIKRTKYFSHHPTSLRMTL